MSAVLCAGTHMRANKAYTRMCTFSRNRAEKCMLEAWWEGVPPALQNTDTGSWREEHGLSTIPIATSRTTTHICGGCPAGLGTSPTWIVQLCSCVFFYPPEYAAAHETKTHSLYIFYHFIICLFFIIHPLFGGARGAKPGGKTRIISWGAPHLHHNRGGRWHQAPRSVASSLWCEQGGESPWRGETQCWER